MPAMQPTPVGVPVVAIQLPSGGWISPGLGAASHRNFAKRARSSSRQSLTRNAWRS